jgi:hypothetical protein
VPGGGLRFTGIEREPRHFETACRRIDAAYRVARLEISEAEARRRIIPQQPLTGGLFDHGDQA